MRNQRQQAQALLDLIAANNPYNKQNLNQNTEFYIYQSGFLASYLASLCSEDPWMLKRFEKHIEQLKSRRR
jgi:hypothetical protein